MKTSLAYPLKNYSTVYVPFRSNGIFCDAGKPSRSAGNRGGSGKLIVKRGIATHQVHKRRSKLG